ncbi:hypothetical protein Y261_15100 [Listeria monocytogenes]|uniref:Uncharacterized protein n=1 Tax=Listeria monocytogenes TaxID=1639 RepID=A0AAN2WJZ1_LISMN|nr:hypothetical protein [Listeria monocytogenes]
MDSTTLNLKEDQIINILWKLFNSGIICSTLKVDDLDNEKIIELSAFLKETHIKEYGEISGLLEEIDYWISEISDSGVNIQIKKKIVDNIEENVKEIITILEIPNYNFEILNKNLLYENSIVSSIHRKEKHNYNIEGISMVAEIYRLFDDNIIEKILFRNFFTSNYKADQKVSAVDFFMKIDSANFSEMYKILENDFDIKKIRKKREIFFEYINELLNNGKNDYNEISLSMEWLIKFFKDMPKVISENSESKYSVYFQKMDDDSIIINNLGPGMGRHFTRYINDFKDKEEVINTFKDHIKNIENKINRKFVDVNTTLGLNVNLHPHILENELDYPNSFCWNENQMLNLSELFIIVNESTKLLELQNNQGILYEISPMGTLFPLLAPNFYKYLCSFSKSNGMEISFWDRFHKVNKNNALRVNHYPSISIGRTAVYIERETWKINKVSSIPKEDSYEDYLKLINYLKHDCQMNEDQIFAKTLPDVDALLGGEINVSDWISLLKKGKYRKPQFYDLNDYVDYKNFVSIYSKDIEEMTIQKVLPSNEKVVEYLMEFTEIHKTD